MIAPAPLSVSTTPWPTTFIKIKLKFIFDLEK
jgi:hypothetical protein